MSTQANEILSLKMQRMTTKELLEVLAHKEDGEWTDEAIETARTILRQRVDSMSELEEFRVEEPFAEEKKADTFYDFEFAAGIVDWSRKLSWVFLGIAAFVLLFNLWFALFSPQGPFANTRMEGLDILSTWILQSVINAILAGMQYVVYFFVLQAISAIVSLLMDIEENTRRSVQRRY